ncbi:hypothetical protein SUGI_0198320 [Cryptomeria japonica]|nr:hypothetical protein SUGI_0198320 [Cryptomeria japonica]
MLVILEEVIAYMLKLDKQLKDKLGSIEVDEKRVMSDIKDKQGQTKNIDQWKGNFDMIGPNIVSFVCADEELNIYTLNTILDELFSLEMIFDSFSKETRAILDAKYMACHVKVSKIQHFEWPSKKMYVSWEESHID